MKIQFAECDENQSGQRFLDSSAPRLIRHVASCETAGGGIIPLPAGKEEKLSRGAGQSPAVSARAARLSSSLDQVQIKRDKPKHWKRNCGRFTVRGASSAIAGKTRYCRVGCKCWDCGGCAPRRAAAYCIRIAQTAEKLKLNKLLTLTLDPSKLDGADSTRYINEVFADFRVYLRRKLGHSPAYIRVLEYQKNGNAHLHVLLNCYLPQDWVSEAWSAVGGGRIVDIKRVDLHRVSRYLSKYLTKQMLLCAPKRARRVTTSRCIQLFAKQQSDFAWRLIKVPIVRLFDLHRSKVTRINPDADGYLVAFETFEIEWDLGFTPCADAGVHKQVPQCSL
ncbi:rolling circle replication-associated protein [Alloacidobacterium sp.]|uniref:rolling circle replication-associated protein n=1 Tax=Alloacidobacterium sp. TaxID=2951999 RepID=UPI002D33DF02|nr:hypothetical protein [Alloacidobacterium sp.]HYK37040.1 hypothetical protein [Alloacidobacterium sp.]